mgnify:CR=1 FL=1
MPRRPHADLIIEWANDDSIEIQARLMDGDEWVTFTPDWSPIIQYRIKPKKVYPVTSITSSEARDYYTGNTACSGDALVALCNEAIKRHIDEQEEKK